MNTLVNRIKRVPRHVIWEITSACNLRCVHCEGDAGVRRRDELTAAEALDLCDALIAEGCRTCNISGGEPLLRRDWDAICRRLAGGGVRVTLVSNAAYLDGDALDAAARAGVSRVALSLDGLRDTHDRIRPFAASENSNYDQVMAALDRLRGAALEPAVITHICRWNFSELEEMHRILAERGVRLWQVQIGLPIGRLREIGEPYMITTEQLRELAARLAAIIERRAPPTLTVTDTIGYYTPLEPVLRSAPGRGLGFWTGCYAGILGAGIESNGSVKGCSSMPSEFTAGNVRELSFREIWADENRFAYNTRWKEEHLTGYCARCVYRRVCRAGCTSLAYSVTGTIYENPYCLHRLAALEDEREGGGASP